MKPLGRALLIAAGLTAFAVVVVCLVRQQGSRQDREYREMLRILDNLIRVNTWPPPPHSVYDNFVIVRYRMDPKQYYLQQMNAHESNLWARGYLVRTNLGAVPDCKAFLQSALTNSELTGCQFPHPKITSNTKWCSPQPSADTNEVTMIILKDEVGPWMGYRAKWIRQHSASNSGLQEPKVNPSADPTNLLPATSGSLR